MVNIFKKNFVINSDGALLNTENVAIFLGISTATVKNWVKCGFLQTIDENTKNFFNKKDIEGIRFKIINGDLEKLNRRANKVKSDRTFTPAEYVQDKIALDGLNCVVNFIKNNNIDLFSALFFCRFKFT